MRSPGTFVIGLICLLGSFVTFCCFWPIGLILFPLGVVLMIVGGRSEPAQQNVYQAYYPPQQQQLPPPPQPQYPPPPQGRRLRQNPDGTWS